MERKETEFTAAAFPPTHFVEKSKNYGIILFPKQSSRFPPPGFYQKNRLQSSRLFNLPKLYKCSFQMVEIAVHGQQGSA